GPRSDCSRRSGGTTSTRVPTSSTSTCGGCVPSSAPRRSRRCAAWGTASMDDRGRWPNRDRWIFVAWVVFSIANLVAMLVVPSWETVPFHFIWVSLTILYGFQVWRTRPTAWVLAVVMLTTGLFIGIDIHWGEQSAEELT